MAKTPSGTVAATGAGAGSFLIGIAENESNRGLRIKVHQAQARDGRRIEGSFDLVDAGTGRYWTYLRELVGQSFTSAAELLNQINRMGGNALKCSHILNRNMLRLQGRAALSESKDLVAQRGPVR